MNHIKGPKLLWKLVKANLVYINIETNWWHTHFLGFPENPVDMIFFLSLRSSFFIRKILVRLLIFLLWNYFIDYIKFFKRLPFGLSFPESSASNCKLFFQNIFFPEDVLSHSFLSLNPLGRRLWLIYFIFRPFFITLIFIIQFILIIFFTNYLFLNDLLLFKFFHWLFSFGVFLWSNLLIWAIFFWLSILF